MKRIALVTLMLLGSGCYRESGVSVAPVPADLSDRRWLSSPRDAAFTSTWREEGGAVVGSLRWQRCVIDRKWTTGHTRSARREPNKTTGAILLATGLVIVTSSFLIAPDDPTDETAFAVRLIGVGVGGTGSTLLLWTNPKRTVERVDVRRHQERTIGECLPVADRAELKLVLRLPNKKGLVGALDRDGVARIEIPADMELPRDVDLPIHVHRLPDSAENLLRHGQWIGRVRLGPEAPAPPADSD